MKRSEINAIMKDALKLFDEYKISLPPFAKWTPEEWKQKGDETQEIKDNMLGWDITDYGQGDFDKVGLLLITLRNGSQENPEKYAKPYAEKLMLVREQQLAPMHFHWYKMEDIINRGGGNLMLQLYNSTADEQLADTEVTVSIDGVQKTFPAGAIVRLTPGESITLPKGLYHSFWGEEGKGTVIVQEVSMTNDDNMITGSMKKWDVSRRLKKTKRRCICCAMSTTNNRISQEAGSVGDFGRKKLHESAP